MWAEVFKCDVIINIRPLNRATKVTRGIKDGVYATGWF